MTPDMHASIDTCQSCHAACLGEAMNHCLEAGGEHVEPSHFRIMMDCAQICATTADFMLRGSAHHTHLCRECADICEACATSCETVGGMQGCIDACRRCAESCRKMAAMAA
jgi:hypothetical protein